jgi:selenide, water dikinase
LPDFRDERLLIGSDTMDDAGVYKLTDEIALIQTLDFFTPIVDDPHLFGQIAAANALSDVYAMGGVPIIALNIVCFPSEDMDLLTEVLLGGAQKVKEADALLVGGHSVEDPEPKYGLSVTGTVHPLKVISNAAAKVGDVLVLTKPLGTGILTTAVKGRILTEADIGAAIQSMAALNRVGAEEMQRIGVTAATDITGFGFLGHAREMAQASGVALEIQATRLPLLPLALDMAEMGLLPGGLHANRHHLGTRVRMDGEVPTALADVLFDPQTSGGLLMAIAADKASILIENLKGRGVLQASPVGRVVDGAAGTISVKM